MSACADVGSFIESKTSVAQTSNVGFTSEVPDYLVVHTGPAGVSVSVNPYWTHFPPITQLCDLCCVKETTVKLYCAQKETHIFMSLILCNI